MTAKPVPEHISDERLEKVLERVKRERDQYEPSTISWDRFNEYVLALTELQHRREAEAGAPEGWVQVPRELTLDMEQAHYDAHAKAETVFASAQEVWNAILAASPSSPASGVRVKLHRFRPIGADRWSEWRFGPANLTPASGCEWEDVDFVPARSALGEHP